MTHSNELHQSTAEYSDQAAVEAADSLMEMNGGYPYGEQEYTPDGAEQSTDSTLEYINVEASHKSFFEKAEEWAKGAWEGGKKKAIVIGLAGAIAVTGAGCGADVGAKPVPTASETVNPSETAKPIKSEDEQLNEYLASRPEIGSEEYYNLPEFQQLLVPYNESDTPEEVVEKILQSKAQANEIGTKLSIESTDTKFGDPWYAHWELYNGTSEDLVNKINLPYYKDGIAHAILTHDSDKQEWVEQILAEPRDDITKEWTEVWYETVGIMYATGQIDVVRTVQNIKIGSVETQGENRFIAKDISWETLGYKYKDGVVPSPNGGTGYHLHIQAEDDDGDGKPDYWRIYNMF